MNYFPQYNNQPFQYQQPPQNNGLIWVQGEAGAKSYLVAPGSTVILMDSEGEHFFLKTADASGMPTLRTFKYSEVGAKEKTAPAKAEEYATKKELEELTSRCMAIEKILSEKPKKGAKDEQTI